MSGSDSQPYFKLVLDALMGAIPKVTRTEFKKLGHLAADNMGCPVKIAEQLISFYNKQDKTASIFLGSATGE